MNKTLEKLTGGDLRSIGRADEVVAEVLAQPALFAGLFAGITVDDPIVRMRAADAVEKITLKRPDLLQPYRPMILNELTKIAQQEVRWHVCQIIPRLALGDEERRQAFHILEGFLGDKSRIVRTFALQALADLAADAPGLRARLLHILQGQAGCGIPSVESRSKKLLARLQKR